MTGDDTPEGKPFTGWPPGLLQDDSRALFEWFASRLDAREGVRDVCGEQRVNLAPKILTVLLTNTEGAPYSDGVRSRQVKTSTS